MRQGTAAVLSGQADLAEQQLGRVLKKDPENAEAARLMADVHRIRGSFLASEQALDNLWKAHGFDDTERELAPAEKALRSRMDEQYNDLYAEWVGKIDPTEDPETYEAVLRRGLARAPRSNRLNTLIVEFLIARAERAIEGNRKEDAAKAYEEVLAFGALPNVRTEAQEKARNLRLELFSDAVDKRLETEVKPRRTVNGQWSTERNGAMDRITMEVDRALRPENPADVVKVRELAREHVAAQIAKLVADLTGVQVDIPSTQVLPAHHTQNETFKRGVYSIDVIVAVDVAKKIAFDHENARGQTEVEP